MAALAPSTLPPNIGAITSAQLIGSLLDFFLFGTLLVQVCIYHACFPHDMRAIKWLVYTVFAVMLVCTCLNAADAHYWYATGFGDLTKFGQARLSPFYTPLMGSVVALAVQLFFCYRISVFRASAMWWSALIAAVSFLQAAGGMGGGIKALIVANQQHDEARTILVYMWLVGDAVADIMIAVTMTHLLTQAEEPQTRDIVRGVIRLIIETNSFSASVAIIGLALFAGMPSTGYFICPTMILPGIYANTLLVLLNNRATPARRARDRAGRSDEEAIVMSDGTTTNVGSPATWGKHTRGYTPDTMQLGALVAAANPDAPVRSASGAVGAVSMWDDASYKDPGRWDDRAARGSLDLDLGDIQSHPYGAGEYTSWR
ncbi:hypothetical protein B0H15DRAFT_958799 [Mycena belliarum]|uniref:DUF6534 domain-containing protein n=1 Tax=Mycena belliarum TaxID=1033014 RepID=A0AAD6XH98_9AGAR|nr:hypothetical protein B0H15DRAFT_958799 [Mycena belliae]